MKIFSDELPEGYLHKGRYYKMNTDFRVWLRIENILSDNDIAPDISTLAAVRLAFDVFPPADEALFSFMKWFCICGEELSDDEGHGNFRAYSSAADEGYIYAAFLQQYHIDLAETNMHWWKYQALFRSLKNTKFNDIAAWRSADISSDMTGERRAFLEKMQRLYSLPDTLTDIMRRENSMNYYRNGGG